MNQSRTRAIPSMAKSALAFGSLFGVSVDTSDELLDKAIRDRKFIRFHVIG